MILEHGSSAENFSMALDDVRTFCLWLSPSRDTYFSSFTFNFLTFSEKVSEEGPRLGSYCKSKHFEGADVADCLFSGKF